MARFIVTGGSGFIGSSIIDLLTRQEDHFVRALLRAAPDTGARGERLAALEGRPNLEPVVVDEWSAGGLAAAMDDGFDAVLHLAGAGVHPKDRSPVSLVDANVRVTAAIAEAWAAPKRFVYAGTCAEYGRVPDGIRVVETAPVRPIESYGATKAAAAVIGRALVTEAGGTFVHARAFGVYGVGEPSYRLIPYLVGRLRAGEAVDLTPGAQVRDFMFIEDCARALIHLAGAPVADGVYNVCTGVPVSVADIALEACRAVGAPPSRIHLGARPYRAGESMWMVGDPARLAATGFEHEVDLAEGIRRTVADIEEQ